MKVFGLFALGAAAVIAASMGALMLLFCRPDARHALILAAVFVFAVHLAVFAVARWLKPRNVWLAWGVGSVLRLGTLIVWAVLVAKVLAVLVVPALIGCATFLFLPTLIEPLLLLK